MMDGIGIDLGTVATRIAFKLRNDKSATINLIEDPKTGSYYVPPIAQISQYRVTAGVDASFGDSKYIINNMKNLLSNRYPKSPNCELSTKNNVVYIKSGSYNQPLSELFKLLFDNHYRIYINKKKKDPGFLTITVPPYFDQTARSIIETAAKKANFRQVTTINENTAAVIAFRNYHKLTDDGNYLVFNCGELGAEASIVQVTGNRYETKVMYAINGFGGKALTEKFVSIFKQYLIDDNNPLPPLSPEKEKEIFHKMNEAKKQLTGSNQKITFEACRKTFRKPIGDIYYKLSDLIEQATIPLDDMIENGYEFDHVVITGHTAMIPAYKEEIYGKTDSDPDDNWESTQADGAIAVGAALYSEKRINGEIIEDVTVGIQPIYHTVGENLMFDIGLKDSLNGFLMLFNKGCSLPAKRIFKMSTLSAKQHTASIVFQKKIDNSIQNVSEMKITQLPRNNDEQTYIYVTVEAISNEQISAYAGVELGESLVSTNFSVSM